MTNKWPLVVLGEFKVIVRREFNPQERQSWQLVKVNSPGAKLKFRLADRAQLNIGLQSLYSQLTFEFDL